jgi:hypothetical protein
MTQTHTIQRTIVELQLPTQDQAYERQSAISRLFQTALPKAMEAVFSAIVPSDSVVKLDRLEIDLGDIAEVDFTEDVFETRCVMALEQALKQAISEQIAANSAEVVFKSSELSGFEAFVFFIQHGRLPWSFTMQSEEEWLFQVLTCIEKEPKSAAILRGPLLANSDRLIQQFRLTFLWVLIERMFPNWAKLGLRRLSESINVANPTAFWKDVLLTLLQFAAAKNVATVSALLERINATIAASNAPFLKGEALIAKHLNAVKLLLNVETEKKGPLSINDQFEANSDGVGEEAMYVNQAGLVLLFPFIESFFNQTQLIENKAFINEMARAKAVHLLHYLATQKTSVGEYDLTLEKILCGVPTGMPIERDLILTENDLKSADDLLGVVIKYWTALGTCSPNGLRETFLQRPAKLSTSADGNWLLQVERRTVDVLMDKLPWGCSMVKTTWMTRLMVVEW